MKRSARPNGLREKAETAIRVRDLDLPEIEERDIPVVGRRRTWLESSEKTIAILGDRLWPPTAE